MPWVLASLCAAAFIAVTEWACRAKGAPEVFFWVFPLALTNQVFLWQTFSKAPSLLTGWIVFTVANSACRLVVAKVGLGEQVDWRHIAIVTVMIGLALLMKEIGHGH